MDTGDGGLKWVAWGLNIGVRSMVIGILFVGAGWIWHLSPDLEEMIKTYLKNEDHVVGRWFAPLLQFGFEQIAKGFWGGSLCCGAERQWCDVGGRGI